MHTFCCLAAIATIATPSLYAQEAPSSPPWNQADAVFGAEEMAGPRARVLSENGGQQFWFVLFNQLEHQGGGEDTLSWNGQASYGGDVHRLWFKSEGEIETGEDEAEIQALYSRAIAPFWNIQGGVRHDVEPDGLNHAVIAINGLAPYWFEIDASAFLSEEGDLTARLEAEYELLITQRWILQPRLELNAAAQEIRERGLGSGITHLDAGLRLRYAVRREFAPYLGVEWQTTLGGTRDQIVATGADADELRFLVGVRAWF